MQIARDLYKSFRQDIGKELQKQRLVRSWTMQRATEEFKLGNPQVLDKVEHGASKRFFLIFALIGLYGCKLDIRLIRRK